MVLIVVFAVIFIVLFCFMFLKKNKHDEDDFFKQECVVSKNTPVANKVLNSKKSEFEGCVDSSGLYPVELLVLQYAPRYYANEKEYPSFWNYKYGLENVDAVLEKLVQKGFLKKELNLELNLNDLKIPDLKIVLKNNSLPVSGKKEEIVKRIVENISLDKLDKSLTKKRYLRTEKGEISLKNAPYITYFDKHSFGISLFELSTFVNKNPLADFKDGFLEIFDKDIKNHEKNGDYGLCRNAKWSLMEFYKAENRLMEAYFVLLEIIFIDINDFLGNGFTKDLLQIKIEYFFSDEPVMTIPPAAFELMNYFQSSLNISEEQLRQDMANRWIDFKIPYHVLSVNDCMEIYFSEKDDDLSKIKKIYSVRKPQNLMEKNGESSLIMGRLECGYKSLCIAQEASNSKDYLRARVSFMKSVESFKQIDAFFELEKAMALYKNFVKIDPIFKALVDVLLEVIWQNPGILQSDITGQLESKDWSALYGYNRPIVKDDVYYALYFADEFGLIMRKKKGRTYELFAEKI